LILIGVHPYNYSKSSPAAEVSSVPSAASVILKGGEGTNADTRLLPGVRKGFSVSRGDLASDGVTRRQAKS